MKRAAGYAIKIGGTIVLLALLARRVPLGEAFARLDVAGARLWCLGIALNGLVLALSAYRWHLTSLRSITMRTCIEYTWIGQFFSLVLPGNVVGDVAKTASLAVGDSRHRTIVLPVSVVLDRLLGLISLLLIFAGALAAKWWDSQRALALAVPAACIVASVLTPQLMGTCLALIRRVSFAPRGLTDMLEKTGTVIARLHGRPWVFLLALSLVMHVIIAYLFAVAARELGMAAEAWRLGLYYVGMCLVIMLPVTFAGLGAREQLSMWLLGASAGAAVMPVTLSWFLLLTSAVHAAVGGVLQAARWLRAGGRSVTPAGTP